jgi:prevent-host-death family protein
MAKSSRTTIKHPSSHTGAEAARARLPSLIDAAEHGHSTMITRRGRAVAALVPVSSLGGLNKQQSLLSVMGSGRGLWGANSTKTLHKLRDEWNR